MEAMTVLSGQELSLQHELGMERFQEFIAWIDRGENTTRTYIINLRQFIAWMRYAAVSRPVRQDIISYRQWLTAEHEAIQLAPDTAEGWRYRTDRGGRPVKVICKPSTVRAYLRSVCQFFKWTAANGYYPDIAANIHAPKVDNSQHKKDCLTPAQVLCIENCIAQKAQEATATAGAAKKDRAGRVQRSTEQGKRLAAMYLLAVNCGLRTIELSRANVKDIQVRDGQAVLYVWGKGRSEPDQRKAIAPEVYAAVKEYLNCRADKPGGTSPLFVSTGNRSRGQRIDPTTISKMLKAAMIDAGYNSERLTAHSLRHSAGTAVQSITGDLLETQKYMRHSDPKTTEIYIHSGEDEERKAASLAQSLYNLYHGISASSEREALEETLARLTPAQIEQLSGIAAAMAR